MRRRKLLSKLLPKLGPMVAIVYVSRKLLQSSFLVHRKFCKYLVSRSEPHTYC